MSNPARRRVLGGRLKSFSALVHEIFQSPQFDALSPRAAKLLIQMYCQYRGTNNGDLCASWSIMRKRGWRSKSQLQKALAELDVSRWLVRTRQGGIHKASLYAVTFLGIDRCGGKLDVGSDPKPAHSWKYPETSKADRLSGRRVRTRPPALHTGQLTPHEGANVHAFPPSLPRTKVLSSAS
jgi:hypothetical protein